MEATDHWLLLLSDRKGTTQKEGSLKGELLPPPHLAGEEEFRVNNYKNPLQERTLAHG